MTIRMNALKQMLEAEVAAKKAFDELSEVEKKVYEVAANKKEGLKKLSLDNCANAHMCLTHHHAREAYDAHDRKEIDDAKKHASLSLHHNNEHSNLTGHRPLSRHHRLAMEDIESNNY